MKHIKEELKRAQEVRQFHAQERATYQGAINTLRKLFLQLPQPSQEERTRLLQEIAGYMGLIEHSKKVEAAQLAQIPATKKRWWHW